MLSSSLSLLAFAVLLQVVPNYSTIATLTATTAAGATLFSLTGVQLAGIAGLGLLTKAAALAAGALVARAQSSGRNGRYRGRREAVDLENKVERTLEMLSELEPEECFKRVLCAVETGG